MGQVIYLTPPGGVIIQAARGKPCPLPFFISTVPAGFPSPAEDYSEESLDINDLIMQHPAATFYVRVKGDSMTGAGIFDGCILAVDRSLTPHSGNIVLAVINGDVTVKRLIQHGDCYILQAENPAYPPIQVPEGSELQVWGVVTYIVNKAR